MNDFVQLRRYAEILLRRWWLIVLATTLGAGIGYEISRIQPKIYTAYTTLIVGQSIDATNPDSKDFQVGEQLVQTYANLVRREPVLRGTVEQLKLTSTWQELQKRVQTRRIEGTQLLEVVIEAGSPDEARRTANEVARQLVLLGPAAHVQDAETSFVNDQLAGLRTKIEQNQARVDGLRSTLAVLQADERQSGESSKQAQEVQREIDTTEALIAEWQNNYTQIIGIRSRTKPSNNLTVIEPAQVDLNATRPKSLVNGLVAGGVTMSLAIIYLLVRGSLSAGLGSAEDLRSLLGLACLGTVGVVKGKHFQEKLITVRQPFSAISEAYRILNGNLLPLLADRRAKTILVTSPVHGEGKTVTVANLAVVMAESGLKTILIDVDLRQPRLHEIFELTNGSGVTDLIQSAELKLPAMVGRSKQRGRSMTVAQSPEVEFGDILQSTSVKNLQVITAGTLPSNPSELLNLLNSSAIRQLFGSLKEIADVILLDSPPMLPVADTAVLATKVDAVLMVIQADRTKQAAVKQAVSHLQQLDAKLLGGVLNRISSRRGIWYTNVVPRKDRIALGQASVQERSVIRDRSVLEHFSALFISPPTSGYNDAQATQDTESHRSDQGQQASVPTSSISLLHGLSTEDETLIEPEKDRM